MKELIFKNLGKRPYAEVLKLQKELRAARIAGQISDTVLTVEHPKVITRGRRPSEEDFVVSPDKLRKLGFAIEDAGRGGKLTYHGPGQLVAYFIVSLKERRLGIPAFVRKVEEAVIQTLREFGVEGRRHEDYPGVWVESGKIASIGLAIDRGVSMHGVALNIDPEMEDFKTIIPCGIPHCRMSSLSQETSRSLNFEEVEGVFQKMAAQVFS
jgi:lipoate-protein ligase B